MSFKTFMGAAAAALIMCGAASAGDMADITVRDAYARSSTTMSDSGAAFMVVMNAGQEDDRLVSVSSDVAERVELHTHVEDENGVMKMVHVTDGFAIPAGGMHALARGGDHVMFLGLKRPLEQGDIVNLDLTFEKAGTISVEVPVDLERKPGQGMQHMHGQMKPKAGG
ncbi:MAG: copper chaperone PCu(A)C [Rhodobacteraceae bacterium]|nr:copper chaperone PCu(A)C [Paracoccaceae bacterium]